MTMKKVKSLLKMVMVKNGVKVTPIAEQIGMDRQQLSNWLYLDDSKSLQKFSEIADILGCDIALIDRESGYIYR